MFAVPSGSKQSQTGGAAREYRAKTNHEALRISRSLKKLGHPAPMGDPASGLMLVVEPPAGPRILDAVSRSLESLSLSSAYVTFSVEHALMEQILMAEPSVLAAIGPDAVRGIDALDYPLARSSFSEAEEGVPFAWTRGTVGLVIPPLAPALDDEHAKRRFWRGFLTLRDLAGPS